MVKALIVPADAGERLLNRAEGDNAWDAWQGTIDQLLNEAGKKTQSEQADALYVSTAFYIMRSVMANLKAVADLP